MTASGTDAVAQTVRAYFKDTRVDSFYRKVWGGEHIHIGLYERPGDSIRDASQRTVERMASMLTARAGRTRVLDLGAGYGGAARHLAAENGWEVDCVNLSELQNEMNRARNAELGLSDRVRVFDGSFDHPLPFDDVSYDVVWSQDAFLHSTDHAKLFREIDRVVRPSGDVIFTDLVQTEDCPQDVVELLLERIRLRGILERLPSFELYRGWAEAVRWETVAIHDWSEHLESHYGGVQREVERRYAELADDCGEPYLDSVIDGLKRWVEVARQGHLRWGLLHFRSSPAR
jgi:sarcosine/dimethylglycine N-methyltransferase